VRSKSVSWKSISASCKRRRKQWKNGSPS
jgi:hypothetical protein